MDIGTPGRARPGGPWRVLRPSLPRPTVGDAAAGVAVALVLIPQSLAYAVLAGMPPAVGLVVGAVATIAAAPFVSSPYLQTGPVAITSLLTFGAVSTLATPGSAPYVGLAALLALLVGAIRLAIGASGIGAVAYLMSRPVILGFVPAAGALIVLSQLPPVLGVTADGRTVVDAVRAVADVGAWDSGSLGLAAVTLLVLRLAPRLHRRLPAVLLAVVVGMVVAELAGHDGATVGALPAELPGLALDLPLDQLGPLVVPALVLAVVGFAEPAAIARTYARQAGQRWDADREFVGQGVANVAAGLFGGFPAGGSFSRSAVGRDAGAATSWTGLLAGLLVLVAIPVADVLADLPLSVLGAVIVSSVLSLLDVRPVLRLRRLSRQQFVVALVTAVAALATAPGIHWAIIAGVVLSLGAHLRREARLTLESWQDDDGVLHLRPTGVLFFGSAHHLEDGVRALVADHPDATRLVVHLDQVGRTDVTGAFALEDVVDQLAMHGVEVTVEGLTSASERVVTRTLELGDAADRRGD